MPTPGWEIGKWLCICQRCGAKKVSDQVSKEWTGLLVCTDRCLDQRHPQDFVRGVPDDQSVPYVAPEPTDVEIDPGYISETIGVQDLDIPAGTFDNSL